MVDSDAVQALLLMYPASMRLMLLEEQGKGLYEDHASLRDGILFMSAGVFAFFLGEEGNTFFLVVHWLSGLSVVLLLKSHIRRI